jgi:transmembrane sensor
MYEKAINIGRLIQKYLEDDLNESERKELDQWLSASEMNASIFFGLTKEDSLEKELQKFNNYDVNIAHEKLAQLIDIGLPKPARYSIRQIPWLAAASILLLFSTAGYFLFFNNPVPSKDISAKVIPATNRTSDIKSPQINRAAITLANGEKIYLDSARNGILAMEQNVNIAKLDNTQISYLNSTVLSAGGFSQKSIYNTLTNPQGSKINSITLSDGSRVWLNSGSSITFPVAFVGKERKVQINGECYFEVAHNTTKPFLVNVNDRIQVQVLGTHFNVNAYGDERNIQTTLLEGSVKIIKGKSKMMLKPGQQASLNENNQFSLNTHANVEDAVLWKNGKFSFVRADVKTLLRQISRWYDVEIVYEGEIPKGHYTGKPSRDLSLTGMLKLIDYSGVDIRIEGKRLIVSK